MERDSIVKGADRRTQERKPEVIERTIALFRKIPLWVKADIIIPFAVTRLGLCLVAWLGFHLWHPETIFSQSWYIDAAGDRRPISTVMPTDPHPFVNMWSRWDAGWYLEIARSGYSNRPGEPSSTAFFPMYPALVRVVHDILLLPARDYWFLVSGILVSNASLLVALIYFRALVMIDYGAQTASRVIVYLLVFPTSFFLSSVYAESLFLALTLTAFFYARKARWTAACLLASLAALCRSQGILILLPLLVEYLQQREFQWRRIGWNILQFVFIPIPLFLFVFWLKAGFGSLRIIFEAQGPWGRQLMWPWESLSWILRHSPPLSPDHHEWLDFSFLCLLCAAAVMGLRQLRPAYSVYAWAAVIFFLSWGMLGSVPRFDLAVFPLFIVLGLFGARFPAFHAGYLITASMLAGLFMVIHSQWNWIA